MAEPVLLGVKGRKVAVAGVGLLCPAGIGEEGRAGGRPGPVPGFRARAYIADRKSIKLMTRAVQLGVSGVALAAAAAGDLLGSVPPDRRGMYVGASPQTGDSADLQPALEVALDDAGRFHLDRFAHDGIGMIHPLWLVRGLSNNVLGFASAIHDTQGVNMNYCDGEDGGWSAIVEGARAVAEGRADVVIAGGADALVEASAMLGGRRCGEGAAFLVLRVAQGAGPTVPLDRRLFEVDEHLLGYLGAATWPVAVARHILARAATHGA